MSSWLQLEMKKPVKNKVCGHTYEEEAIVRMIESKHKRKKKTWWVAAGREVALPRGGQSQAVCSCWRESCLNLPWSPFAQGDSVNMEAGFQETQHMRGKISNLFGKKLKELQTHLQNTSKGSWM